jgi:hypothetical protein
LISNFIAEMHRFRSVFKVLIGIFLALSPLILVIFTLGGAFGPVGG